ncbi:MAG TPA: DUF4232 domain-containing protein [Acidimicrobiales bacterium]
MSRALKTLAIFFAFVAIYTLSRHTSGTTTTTSTTTTINQSTSSTTTIAGTTCHGTDFHGVFNQGQGAAGTIYASITLTKTTTGTCTVKGWPILTLQDRTGGVLPSNTIDLPSSASAIQFPEAKANAAPSLLTMSDGSSTTFALAYSDVPVGTETCGSATSIAVEISKQGSSVSITPTYPQQPCNHGSVWVSPFF